MRRLFLGCLLCLCATLSGLTGFALATPAVKSASALPSVYAPFVGQWTGTLEYRDYQSNARVKLPTTLTIQTFSNGKTLHCHYVYDDGPGKIVQETETVTIDPAAGTYSVLADGDQTPNVYQTASLPVFTKARSGTLVLHGFGEDNNQVAEFRKTVMVTAKTLIILKEVRSPDGVFQFRNQYTFTRMRL